MTKRNGFTLIEVLVATAVLGIAGTALFSLLSRSLFNLRRVEDLHQYELAGEDIMNRVMLLPALPAPAQVQGPVENSAARWIVQVAPWAPADLEGKPERAVLRVAVFVAWPGRSSERKIELEALKPAQVIYSNFDLREALAEVIPQ